MSEINVFQSNNGMQTSVWGPVQWLMLHIISFNYPCKPNIKQKLYYWDYLISLKNVLPCVHCRNNMQKNLCDAGLSYGVFDNRQTFSKFIFDFHNKVNEMIKGKVWDKDYTFLKEQIECIRARCSNKTSPKAKQKKHPKEKGCTEPIVLGCPASAQIVLQKKSKTKKPSVQFKFGRLFFAPNNGGNAQLDANNKTNTND